MSILNNVLDVLKENSFYFYTIIGAAVILVGLIIAMIIVKSVRNKNELTKDERFIKETLQEEQKELAEQQAKENGNENTEEALNKKKKDKKKKNEEAETLKSAEEPQKVLEEKNESLEEKEVQEEAPVVLDEEVTEEASEPKKKSRQKKAKETKTSEVEVLEETPVEDEPVLEESAEEEAQNEEKPNGNETKKRVVYGKYLVCHDGTNYFYVLKASNGEVLIKSENYTSRDTVYQAIESIKRNVKVGRIEIMPDKHGLYQFALIARNNRKLVLSATYKTQQRAHSAANSFKRFADISPIVELSEKVEQTQEEIQIEKVSKKGGRLGVLTLPNGGFYYLLKASNGEILVRSIVYKSNDSAQRALSRFKEAVNEGKFVVDRDKKGLFQFKLFSKANRVVVTGEAYDTKAQAISSANSAYSFVEFATDFDPEEAE